MLRSILLTTALGISLNVLAQSKPDAAIAQGEEAAARAEFGQRISPEMRARAEAIAREIDEAAKRAIAKPLSPSVESMIANAKRRADDIADESLAADRDKVLSFLGVDPQGEHALYYFVSWSMPLDVLRAYAIEAMWAGGTLVFKGVPPGRDLKTFLVDDLGSLVWGKGGSASIAMDPRLFETYAVSAVPSIVITKDRRNLTCGGKDAQKVDADVDGVLVQFSGCPSAHPDSYIKLTGAVTSDYALRTFVENGADYARPFQAALRKGVVYGENSVKGQVGFKGEWKDVVTPAMRMEYEQKRKEAEAAAQGD